MVDYLKVNSPKTKELEGKIRALSESVSDDGKPLLDLFSSLSTTSSLLTEDADRSEIVDDKKQ